MNAMLSADDRTLTGTMSANGEPAVSFRPPHRSTQ